MMRRRLRLAGAVRSFLGAWLALLAARDAAAQSEVGQLEPTLVESAHPYPRTPIRSQRFIVAWPGASYLRLHFARVELAPGDRLTIADRFGRERFDLTAPEIGNEGFWAPTIGDDLVTIELQSVSGGAYGFRIDSFGHGEPPASQPTGTISSVCGVEDWQDVACLRSSAPDRYRQGRGAVLALIGCCTVCTAFKVGDEGLFLTNNHCAGSAEEVASIELRIDEERAECGSGAIASSARLRGKLLLDTDATLDYTLFSTSGDALGLPCLPLSSRSATEGEPIFVVGHPYGGPKQISQFSDMDPEGQCLVDQAPVDGNGTATDIGYYCDTVGGSSGSPVISATSGQVVALHHLGGCLNRGVRADLIFPRIAPRIGSCSARGCRPRGDSCVTGGDCCSRRCRSSHGARICR